jgi:hypothetical protein
MTTQSFFRLVTLSKNLQSEIVHLKRVKEEKFPLDVWGGKEEESLQKRIKSLEFQQKRLGLYIP